jgi:hypothetical protein
MLAVELSKGQLTAYRIQKITYPSNHIPNKTSRMDRKTGKIMTSKLFGPSILKADLIAPRPYPMMQHDTVQQTKVTSIIHPRHVSQSSPIAVCG